MDKDKLETHGNENRREDDGLADRFRELRRRKGWTLKEVADQLGTSPQAVSNWEHDQNKPDIDMLPAIASTFDVSVDALLGYQRTHYQAKYQAEGLYWGEVIWEVAYDVLRLMPPTGPVRLLDVGCGEGQAATFFARNGYIVSAFDIADEGLRKGRLLAERARVEVNFFRADLLNYEPEGCFDVVYSRDVLEYVPPQDRPRVMGCLQAHTALGGLNVMSVFVEKSFIETAPDWEPHEFYWQTGELFAYYGRDWKFERIEEAVIDCSSSGVPHQHCMDVMIARRMR